MAMLVITRWYIFKFEGWKKQKFSFHGSSAKKRSLNPEAMATSAVAATGLFFSGFSLAPLVGDRFFLLNLTNVGVLLHDLWVIYGCTQSQPLWSWLLGMYSCMPGLDLSDVIFFLGKMIAIDPFLAQVSWLDLPHHQPLSLVGSFEDWTDWWFGTFGLFFPSYWEFHGISSSQLTFTPSFFRGVGQPPTSEYCSQQYNFHRGTDGSTWLNHQPRFIMDHHGSSQCTKVVVSCAVLNVNINLHKWLVSWWKVPYLSKIAFL